MAEHHATIRWQRRSSDFLYENYNREHEWQFSDSARIEASAAPEYRGTPSCVDPEQALVAALSSCHMLSLLAIAARRRITVDAYHDDAVGFLGRNSENRLAVTRVVLRPSITFGGSQSVDKGLLDQLHHHAHEECFIANSVTTEIVIEPRPSSTTG